MKYAKFALRRSKTARERDALAVAQRKERRRIGGKLLPPAIGAVAALGAPARWGLVSTRRKAQWICYSAADAKGLKIVRLLSGLTRRRRGGAGPCPVAPCPAFVGRSVPPALHKRIGVCYTPRPCAAAVAEW